MITAIKKDVEKGNERDIGALIWTGIFILVYQPSITFGILGNVENFPWAIIFAVSLFAFFRFLPNETPLLLLLFPWFIVPLVMGEELFIVFRGAAAIVNAMIFTFVVARLPDRYLDNAVMAAATVIGLNIMVGTLQLYFPQLWVHDLVNVLVPRAQGYLSLNEGLMARGVSGLSSEPSRQALDICMLMLLLLVIRREFRWYHLALDAGFVFFLLMMNRSFTSIGTVALLYGGYFLSNFGRLPKGTGWQLILIIGASSVWIISSGILSELGTHSRGLAILLQTRSLDDLWFILVEHSGHKIAAQLAVYFNFSLLGSGFGGSPDVVAGGIDSLKLTPFYNWHMRHFHYVDFRPTSFWTGCLAELGVVGLSIVLFAIGWSLRGVGSFLTFGDAFLLALPIFSLLAMGDIGSPLPLTVIFLICRLLARNRSMKLVDENAGRSRDQMEKRLGKSVN